MRKHCYYLAYRQKNDGRSVPWDRPTGGLVMDPEEYVQGHPIGDSAAAYEILQERYHCGPDEVLIMAEVFEKRECMKAHRLHHQWEHSMNQFLEMMDCA